MHQPTPGKPDVEPNITIKRQRLKVVEKFAYLGSTLSKSIVMNDEVNTRLAKASAAFCRLNRIEWNRRSISEATKIKVYRAVVLITLLSGCNVDNLSTAYKEAKHLSDDLSGEDFQHLNSVWPIEWTLLGDTTPFALGTMAMKGYSTFPKALRLEPHHQMEFSIRSMALIGVGVLRLYGDTVGVFYRPI